MSKIKKVIAREVLDSRGNPTVECEVFTDNARGRAIVPSGASTGIHEALELRDKDKNRYKGKGVLKAVDNVNKIIAPELIGMNSKDQEVIDKKMIDLDGTENKNNLGANAILSVSLATAYAAADSEGKELFHYFSDKYSPSKKNLLPTPMMNILNGGAHTSWESTNFQEFMVMPFAAPNLREAVRWGAEIFHTLKEVLKKKGLNTNVGDEGGFAPALGSDEEAIESVLDAIEEAGFSDKVGIALDPACSELFQGNEYHLKIGNKKLSSKEMMELWTEWVNKYPIISIEDGLAEDDFDGFAAMTRELGDKIQIVGDDLLVTNPKRISLGIEKKLCNSVLIKLNQIGTLTETVEAIQMAQKNSWTAVVSHRSGETEDTTIADLAVGLGTGQIKTGSLSRTDRVAKYNRLIRIEDLLGKDARFQGRIF